MLKSHHLILLSAIAICSSNFASASPDIKNLKDLKQVQTKIKTVVKSVLPATVSLNSMTIGAAGSGVIVSKDGLILSAAHVVQGSDEMTVIFPNGKQATAKVLGAHYTRDSAMLQITDKAPPEGWPFAEVGSSKNLKTGDLVIAMGHPGGYDPVRTPPVRFGRYISPLLDHFFNTDCSIIGGDSGGPLYDLEGKVVGIHSSIGESTNANNHASIGGIHQDWQNLLAGKQWGKLGYNGMHDVDAPVLGIITERVSDNGLLVIQVVPNGPADSAGLKEGDIIQFINDETANGLRALQIELSQHQAGDDVKLKILRNRKEIERTVTLGSRGEIFNLLKR